MFYVPLSSALSQLGFKKISSAPGTVVYEKDGARIEADPDALSQYKVVPESVHISAGHTILKALPTGSQVFCDHLALVGSNFLKITAYDTITLTGQIKLAHSVMNVHVDGSGDLQWRVSAELSTLADVTLAGLTDHSLDYYQSHVQSVTHDVTGCHSVEVVNCYVIGHQDVPVRVVGSLVGWTFMGPHLVRSAQGMLPVLHSGHVNMMIPRMTGGSTCVSTFDHDGQVFVVLGRDVLPLVDASHRLEQAEGAAEDSDERALYQRYQQIVRTLQSLVL